MVERGRATAGDGAGLTGRAFARMGRACTVGPSLRSGLVGGRAATGRPGRRRRAIGSMRSQGGRWGAAGAMPSLALGMGVGGVLTTVGFGRFGGMGGLDGGAAGGWGRGAGG